MTTFAVNQAQDRQFRSVNPANEIEIARYEAATEEEIDREPDAAVADFRVWRETSLSERAATLDRLAATMLDSRDALARMATVEMGKPIAQSEAEVDKCAGALRFYAAQGPQMLADDVIVTDAMESYVSFRPLGVVLAVMPWNYPFWQVLRFGAATMLAGNTVVLRHAENVTGCARLLDEVFARATGDGPRLLRTCLLSIPAVHKAIADPRIAAVTFTGSTSAGRQVAASAGQALKRSVVELGGSDPFVVLGDADIRQAARVGAASRFQNAGQSCIAAKRFIVVSSVAEEFVARLVEHAESLHAGDPGDRMTELGPIARADLRDTLDRQVQKTVSEGARLVIGGRLPADPGWFYPPTVLASVRPDMTAFREETFGPVAPIAVVPDAAAALDLANSSEFGLSANLWTEDLDRAKELTARFESGGAFINGMTASDVRLPFGGVKHSGYGRELSAFGAREFTNIQTTWVSGGRSS